MIILPVNDNASIEATNFISTDTASVNENIKSDLTYNGAVPLDANAWVLLNSNTSLAGGYTARAVGAMFFTRGATVVDASIEHLNTATVTQMAKNSGSDAQGVAVLFATAPKNTAGADMLGFDFDISGDYQNVTLVNVADGLGYEFPCIENTQLSPAQFNKDVVYNNNISSKGHFLGRTAVRRGATVTLEPLSFIATIDRMNEILELFEKLETRACYVHYKVADKDFVHYGWTESEPNYRYTADEEYVQVSFTLRCPA